VELRESLQSEGEIPNRGWGRGHMTGYHFKDMDSLIVGCFFYHAMYEFVHAQYMFQYGGFLHKYSNKLWFLCFPWMYVRTCNAIKSIVTINFCWIRLLSFTPGQATWNRAPPKLRLMLGTCGIFQEYAVWHALPEGSCNYLPHIPQNQFILINLFSKDPVNNKEN
jgi:hypothetical protein